jgi:toxin ParE1/3/4
LAELALRDLESISDYIAKDSPRTALRFLTAAERTFVLLADHPHMGTVYEAEDAELVGLRRFPVTGFQSYLIFYTSSNEGIQIVRIIHGARDIPKVLDELG